MKAPRRNYSAANLLWLVSVLGCSESETGQSPESDAHVASGGADGPPTGTGGMDPSPTTDGSAPASGGAGGTSTVSDAGPDPGADAPSDAPEPVDPNLVGVFVAQGHVGRFVMSCDDGRTFPFDASEDDALRCWSARDENDNLVPDCDHHPWAGNGIAYGNGVFVATFGWGPPGGLFRSVDGREWAQITMGTTFAGVAYGEAHWVAGSGTPRFSTNDGETFEAIEPLHYNTSRRTFFADVDGGRFVIAADQNTLRVSSDGGETYWEPSVVAPECGTQAGAGGNGVLVLLQGTGAGCRSTDGGDTWTAIDVGGEVRSNVLFTGSEFIVWSYGVAYRSEDGDMWTSTPTVPGDLDVGAVARSPSGTFVGAHSPWGGFYDNSAFFRSEDGVTWEAPEGSDAARGHPLRAMTFGYVPRSACE